MKHHLKRVRDGGLCPTASTRRPLGKASWIQALHSVHPWLDAYVVVCICVVQLLCSEKLEKAVAAHCKKHPAQKVGQCPGQCRPNIPSRLAFPGARNPRIYSASRFGKSVPNFPHNLFSDLLLFQAGNSCDNSLKGLACFSSCVHLRQGGRRQVLRASVPLSLLLSCLLGNPWATLVPTPDLSGPLSHDIAILSL